MEKIRIFTPMFNILTVCAAFLITMASCSSSKEVQKMSNTNETEALEVGMSEIEQKKVFITMNATFTDEEKCRIAMETIVNDAHAAYGVNSHFWFRSEDEKSLFVLEQYQDKKAVRKALRRFTSARLSFFRSIDVMDVSIHGSISSTSKLMFAALSPQYMEYYGGYSKDIPEAQQVGISDIERNRIVVVMNATFKDEAQCKIAMEGIVEGAYAESGTKTHYWCTSEDGKMLTVFEQYANEEALIEHVMANPPSRAAFFESIEVVDVKVYATVSDQIKEMFAPLNPTYMNYYGGYSK